MIHTMQVVIDIKASQYKYLAQTFPCMEQVSEYTSRSNYYQSKGIIQTELKKVSFFKYGMERKKYYLQLRLNLSQIMGEDKIRLLDGDKYTVNEISEAIMKRLFEINEFRYVKIHEMPIELFRTSRADFAEDILYPMPELLAYLSSISFPYKHYNFERFIPKGKSLEDMRYESCYFKNKRSRAFNFYVKMSEITNNDRKIESSTADDLPRLFRMEIQVKKKGIEALTRDLPTKKEMSHFLDENNCHKYIIHQVKKIFKCEKYVSQRIATEIIENSSYSAETKAKLLSIINLIPVHGGLNELEKAVDEKDPCLPDFGSLSDFRKLLAKIRKLGIQPVVIPNKYEVDEVPSFVDLLSKGEYL